MHGGNTHPHLEGTWSLYANMRVFYATIFEKRHFSPIFFPACSLRNAPPISSPNSIDKNSNYVYTMLNSKYGATRRSKMQRNTSQCGVMQHGATQCGAAKHNTARHSAVRRNKTMQSTAQRSKYTTQHERSSSVMFLTAHKKALGKKPLIFACVTFALCSMLCIALCLTSCVQNNDTTQANNRPIVTAGSADYAPFMDLDNNGKPTGVDVDIITEAFSRAGYDVEFVTIAWEDKEQLLESGEIDCVTGGFTIDGREDDYLWAKPYLYSNQVVVVNADSGISSLQDLEGKNIAVQSSSSAENLLLNHTNPNISAQVQVFSYEDNSLPFAALGCNYVDALIADEPVVVQYMQNNNTLFTILDEPAMHARVSTAFAKGGDAELCAKVNEALDDMYADGTLQEIISSYLGEADKYLEGLDFGR